MTNHLLHVGFPKAGSKYLQQWFAAHPQLAYETDGIAGFRSVYAIAREGAKSGDRTRYRVTSYEGLAAPHGDAGNVAVDYASARPTDAATAQRRVCEILSGLFPRATVLIVTRGFRSMILSSYSQFVRSGGDADLAELVAVMQAGPGSPGYDHLAGLTPWNYDRVIGAYTAAFGADNVIVMPYELLRDAPDEFTRMLSQRLGIDPIPGPRDRINESLSAEEMYWYPRLTRLARKVPSRRLFRLYVTAAFRNRLRGVVRLLQRVRPGRAVTAASIPDAVVEVFRGHAESLRGNPLYERYASDYLI
ncbi:MAG TPA: hypothetical protein VF432_27690 [Thermoanaerobaculia bacterium]